MNMEEMKEAFLSAEKQGLTMSNLGISLEEICTICKEGYIEKYGTPVMNTLKLIEEIDELILAIADSKIISRNNRTDKYLVRGTDTWFNIVEEIEDVDIMLHIVNGILSSELNRYRVLTQPPMYEYEGVGISPYTTDKPQVYIKDLAAINQLLLKGFRKQFGNEASRIDGKNIVWDHLGTILITIRDIQALYNIEDKDIDRMRYVKCIRLLHRYQYVYDANTKTWSKDCPIKTS